MPKGLNTDNNSRLAGCLKMLGRVADRFLYFLSIGACLGKDAVPLADMVGDGDVMLDHVLMDLDVAWQLTAPDILYYFVDICSCRTRVIHNFGGTGNFLKDVKLGFDFFGLMVDEDTQLPFFLARATAHH